MKLLTYTFVLLSLIFCNTNLHSKEPTNVSGKQTIKKQTIENLNANGLVELEEVKITDKLVVNGKLKAEDSTIHILEVNGSAELEKTEIIKKATINGHLEAEKCKIHDLEIKSEKITLEACTVGDIQIRRIKLFYKKPQILELKDGTVVNGTIDFDSRSGIIKLSSNSKINGKVKGAKIENK